jgi:DNA-binding CsgD family transcriptional regulator
MADAESVDALWASLTPRQREALITYARVHYYRGVADAMGIGVSGVRKYLLATYRVLGVDGHLGAFVLLGWLTIPEENP